MAASVTARGATADDSPRVRDATSVSEGAMDGTDIHARACGNKTKLPKRKANEAHLGVEATKKHKTSAAHRAEEGHALNVESVDQGRRIAATSQPLPDSVSSNPATLSRSMAKSTEFDGLRTETLTTTKEPALGSLGHLQRETTSKSSGRHVEQHKHDHGSLRAHTATQTPRQPFHHAAAKIQDSGIFMTADKRVPDTPAVVARWIQDRGFNTTHTPEQPFDVPFPRKPKALVELDQTTPYRFFDYNINDRTSLELALKVVNKDIKEFASDPLYYNRAAQPGHEDSRKMQEARGVKYDVTQLLREMDRKERAEYEQRKTAREDAEYYAKLEKAKYLEEKADYKYTHLLNRPLTPPPGSVRDAKESFEEVRERRGTSVYAARDHEADESRDEKAREALRRDGLEHERQKLFAAKYARPKKPVGGGRKRKSCRECGAEGHVRKECPETQLDGVVASHGEGVRSNPNRAGDRNVGLGQVDASHGRVRNSIEKNVDRRPQRIRSPHRNPAEPPQPKFKPAQAVTRGAQPNNNVSAKQARPAGTTTHPNQTSVNRASDRSQERTHEPSQTAPVPPPKPSALTALLNEVKGKK